MSAWTEFMDSLPGTEAQERALRRAGINPDPTTWDEETFAKADRILTELARNGD